MGLFGSKKQAATPAPAPKPAASADDIWGDKPKTVSIKESKYDEVKTKVVETEGIDPETIRKKMELLEKEFEEKQKQPVLTHADFDTNPVEQGEVESAQEVYEKQYKIEHQKYIDTHQQDITAADEFGVDEKFDAILDETAKRAQATREKNYGIDQISDGEVDEGLAKLHDPKDVTKDKNFKNIESVTDEMMNQADEYIKTQLDTRVVVEEDDEIEEIPTEVSEKMQKEFLEKYKDR